MPTNLIRTLLLFVSLLVCAAGFTVSPPLAHASSQANLLSAQGVVSVDRTTFFDEGRYINLLDHENDIRISDFSVSGGSMIALENGGSRLDPHRNINPYQAVQIPIEGIYGRTESIPGFGFVCDKTASAANGASVSVRYDYVGDMKDIADPTFSIPVSIKATYTIREGQTIDEEGDYRENYTGHPVVHLPKCFSHGVFFCGTNVLDARYEFFDANTGNPIELRTMYVTATSLNRGEGFAVPSDRVSACYVSNEAPPSSAFYNQNGVKTPYGVVAGSYLYDKTSEYDNGYTTFIGCPDVRDSSGAKMDFSDSIGEETFYWRSVCFAIDNGASNTIDAKVYAIKTGSWSGTEGIPGDGWNANGSMWFATNFMTLTSTKPPQPTKTVDKLEGVRLGDTLTYRVAQQVNDLGATSFIRYESLSIVDPLPNTLAFKSARLLDEGGSELGGAGTARFDETTRTVTFDFSESFLASGMSMTGETYFLEIVTEVIDYPDDGTLAFSNQARSIINGSEQPTEEVVTALAAPELAIDKHVVPRGSTTDTYEIGVGDELMYRTTVRQTKDKTRAKGLTVADALPSGLALVSGSIRVSGAEQVDVSEHDGSWSLALSNLDHGDTVDITYRATATATGNGSEVVNTACAWAKNIEAGLAGSEANPVSDDAETFVNSPNLAVSEEVSVSELTGNAYERRVGEPVVFTVTVENTAPGTIANELSLATLSLPEGLSIVDGPEAVSIDGIALDGEESYVRYPVQGNDVDHGEAEQRYIAGALAIADDRCTASLDLNHLPSETPLRLSFTCMPKEAVNGHEVTNRAVAYAANAPDPVENEPAARVWINSPRLAIEKQAPPLAYQAGDTVTYRIDASNKAAGTVANNVVFEDMLETPGMQLLRNSIVVSDQDGDIITDDITIKQNTGTQDWRIETGKSLVNDNAYRIWDCDEGGSLIETGERNPAKIDREYAYRIEYQSLITDAALASQTARNIATVTSDENLPITDDAIISVRGPALGITKSADIGSYQVGDTATYTIETTGLRTGETAHNVRIGDELAADAPRAATILEGSVSVRNERGAALDGWDIAFTDNEAGDHTGFAIDTHADLPDAAKIIVSYQVRFTAKTASKTVDNTAWAEADDAPKATASAFVTCADPVDTTLSIEKTSDGAVYAPGQTARYSLLVRNADEENPARNVALADALGSTDSASVAKGSVVVRNGAGEALDDAVVVYRQDEAGSLSGFSIETNSDLAFGDELAVRYETVLSPDAPAGAVIPNTATASAANTGNASTEHEVTVGSLDPETIRGYQTTAYKTANPASGSAVEPGDEIAYLITVRNTGESVAPFVRVRDYLPEGTTYLLESASEGGAFVRSTDNRNAYVEWVVRDLAPEDERTVGFSVRVDAEPPDHIVNTALYAASDAETIAGDPTLSDPDRFTAKTAHPVEGKAPVGPIVNVVKSSLPQAGETVQAHDEIAYTLIVSNHGDTTAENVLVRDPVPEGATFVQNSASHGGTFHEDTGCIQWLIDSIESGAHVELTFTVVVDASVSTSLITNQASFAQDAADRIGSPDMLENTSNIVEHRLPGTENAPSRSPFPKTGDELPLYAIGIAAAIGALACVALVLACSRRKRESRRAQGIAPAVEVAPPHAKPRPAKRRRKDYIRWR
ncbi:DUF11 domain-containing protein [Raoultibacter phocaeensis]|uniref:DUF7927 domain-containing protein n=1 Tax=Raoultibacter phocaeensis TaxID=2479841 RepID=UPI0015D63356|nr:DUF11 domain-containing protein [Raoultibacter phocaeensis]